MAEPAIRERSFVVRGTVLAAPPLACGLYIVATPIGNLSDVTLRALETLAGADILACEDTRVTSKLLARYGIATRLTSYHEHSGPAERARLLARLGQGEAVALVSDAGTPLLSDPGYRLVVEAIAAGHPIIPIPGASAALAALSASGLPTDTVLFAGFLPVKHAARRKRLAELGSVPATLVLFESPNRLAAMLAEAAAVLGGERAAAICRELTKLHETFARAPLAELAARYAEEAARGEVVVVVAPPGEAEPPGADQVDALLAEALRASSVRDAADSVAAITGLPRRTLYRRAMELKERGP